MMDNQFNCPNCGKPLIFDENFNGYVCLDCNEYFMPEDLYTEEADESIVNDYSDSYVEVQCKLCGKTTIVDKDYSFGVCPFCFNNLIDYNHKITRFKPELIIQFSESKDSFVTHLVETLKKGNCPPELIGGINLDSLKGVYLPFYRYTVTNSYRCFLETAEMDSSKYGSDGFYYQEIAYKENLNVLCDANGIVPNRVIDDFADYDFKSPKMFFPKMLGQGYYTVSNYDSHDKVWKNLNEVVKQYTENNMKKYVGKMEVLKKQLLMYDIKNIVRQFILLPVWIVETYYNNEIHYIYINGQTGRVASDIEFKQVYKKTWFGKEKVEKYQVRFIDEMKVKYKRFNNGIDYHNEVRKYGNNTALKDQKIGAMRTR